MKSMVGFETDHLLTKWGFADGLLLEDLLQQNGYSHMHEDSEEWFEFVRRVLCEVVERFVLPEIENDIRPYRMRGSHNPIRIYEVDGCHMSELDPGLLLRPFTVEVPTKAVLDVAAQLYRSRLGKNGKPISYMVRSAEANSVFVARSWV